MPDASLMPASGFTFENPWFLLGIAVVAVTAWFRARSQVPAVRVGALTTFQQVPATWRTKTAWLADALRTLALLLLIVALARPQMVDQELLSGEGIDIMIALDMSGSMNAVDMSAEHIAAIQNQGQEPDNRFEAARKILKDFVKRRKSDRIGLVVFGNEAFLRFPPTLDYIRLLNAIDGLVLDDGRRTRQDQDGCNNHCTINGSGTAIGDAVNRAYLRLDKAKSRSRMLILITDGKQEGGEMDPLLVPKYITSLPEKERVRIYTFAVGSGQQTRLPAYDPLRGKPLVDRFGRKIYQRPDRPFATDPELLRQIAALTGGKFYDSYDAEKFAKDFEDLDRSTMTVKVHTNRRELFAGWLLAGLGLLVAEGLGRRTVWRKFP
jgi:Ca-activated chloride channel family protein